MDQTAERIARTIATEIAASPKQVSAAVELLDGGATVPFVARYRKEVTGGLDDTQLRTLGDRLVYLREMEARRSSILESIKGRASSPTRWPDPSRRPRPRPRSRTSTSPTSPSAAPRR